MTSYKIDVVNIILKDYGRWREINDFSSNCDDYNLMIKFLVERLHSLNFRNYKAQF